MLKINSIYNMDVLKFLDKLDDNSIDLAIADPPYNIGIADWDLFNNEEEYFDFLKSWLMLLEPKLKKTASLYIFNTAKNSAKIFSFLEESLKLKFQNWIIWYKKDGMSASKKKYNNSQETILFFTKSNNYTFNYDSIRIPYESEKRIVHAMKKGILKNGKRWFPNPKGKLCNDVWHLSSYRHNNKINGKIIFNEHPTPKPIKLIERMIIASSKKDDLILDLFSGIGTTSLLSYKNKRNYIGCELNKNYINIFNSKINELK